MGQVLIVHDVFLLEQVAFLKPSQDRKAKVCFYSYSFFKVTKVVLLLIGEEERM